jgi:hypothetical protein
MARTFILGENIDDKLLTPFQLDDRWPKGEEAELSKKILLVHANETSFTFKHRMFMNNITLTLGVGMIFIAMSLGHLIFLIVSPNHFGKDMTIIASICYIVGFIVFMVGCKKLAQLQREHEQGYADPRIFLLRPHQKN